MGRFLPPQLHLRQVALPIGTSMCVGYYIQGRPAHYHLDSHPAPVAQTGRQISSQPYQGLGSKNMRQLSSGSLYGFGAGLMVGFLSHTLVLLAGATIFIFYMAHRHGLDLLQLLSLRKRLDKATLGKPFQNAVFRLSFATTFTLAAFIRF
ncbi:FUN14 family protein [Colletotrichum sojae]|uniref:FUN14 family protein n=1 Tax=Colletotrichum sojae TaxID=2175907 RepID=A0A8H6IRK9_9PEZI|nr:FUN14 family protein [Colletotrichum sojae]